MSVYSEYFLRSKSTVVQLELLEISHPAFSKVYRVVRNATNGITVRLEDGSLQAFQYYPLAIENGGIRDDLDQTITVSLGDLGEIIPQEIDRLTDADDFATRPTVLYRVYRSDDLEHLLFPTIKLEIYSFAFDRENSTFEAKAPSLNFSATGELYKLDRFPMLRGCL